MRNGKDVKLLLEKSKNGDKKSFEELLKIYNDHIINLASFYSKSLESGEKEDILQEAYLAFIKAVYGFNIKYNGDFKYYLDITIKHHLLNYINKKRYSKKKSFNVETDFFDDYPNPIEKDRSTFLYLIDNIKSIIEKSFKTVEKEVLSLYLLGYSYKEISFKLNITEKQVDNIIYSIKKSLTKYLKDK